MPKKLIKPGILLATVFVVISLLLLRSFAAATTLTLLDGDVTVTNSSGTGKLSGGTVTITAKGSLFGKATNNITITNASGSKAQLSFDYTATSANSFKIAGATADATGSHAVILEAGGTLAITLVSKQGLTDVTATLTLSNFSLATVADSSNVTFNFDSALGSVTVDGAAVTSGDVLQVSGATGSALVAATKSGSTFLGWVDGDGKILSAAASYTLTPAQNMTVRAVFVGSGSKPWFAVGSAAQKSVSSGLWGMSSINYYQVGTTYLFDDLNEAAQKAATEASNKCVVLMNSGTLPAGTYTIPAGVTLLIPFDSANTMYTTQVVNTKDSAWKQPTEYRTLTMADGANLVINGAMSVSAKQATARGSKADGGSPTGDVSFVRMQGNSNITVNNGGALYAYGFITGSGSVTANNGATVYEMFQIMDFRGGTQSTDMDNGVFPLSQYYVQNIEVPMTLYSGAKEYAYTTIYMSSADFGTAINFISNSGSNSGAMFNLTSGYVTKRYDGTTDRLVIEVHGDMTVSAVNMKVGTSSINSKDYELPITNNLTVNVVSGNITIQQDLAFLPGSKMIIGKDAACTLGSGYNIYVYDADEWGNYTFGASSWNTPFKALNYAPGRMYTRTDADLEDAYICVEGTADLSAGGTYTTAGGADVCGKEGGKVILSAGTQTVTYQLIQGSLGPKGASLSTTGYVQIPLTPAKLKNADGSFTETSNAKNATTYTYTNGTWVVECVEHTVETIPGKAATCTESGLTDGEKCSICGTVTVAQTEVPALGHTYESVVTEPTCTTGGYTTHTCTVCGDTYTDSEVAATGKHSYSSEVTTEATCKTTGVKTFTCHCGESYTEVIPRKNHEWGAWSEAGNVFTTTCQHGCEQTIKVTLLYRLQDYVWLNATVEGPEGITLTTNSYGYAFQKVNDVHYLVRKVLAKEIPIQFTVQFTALGAVTEAQEISFDKYKTILERKYDEEWDSADRTQQNKITVARKLLTSMVDYGVAAKAYFDYKALVDANQSTESIEAPKEVLTLPSGVENALNSKDKYYGTDANYGYYLNTQGANILFGERLAMVVNFKMVQTGDTDKNAIDLKTHFGNSLVKVGLLVSESTGSYANDPILSFGADGVTSYVIYGGHDVTYDPSVPDPNEPGDEITIDTNKRDYTNMSISFDLTTEDYLSRFQFRPYVIYKDATGQQQILYGRQFYYGLEDYIARQYSTPADGEVLSLGQQLVNNLLVTTWTYAEAAAEAFHG